MQLSRSGRIVWLLVVLTIILTTLPYVVGALSAPAGTTFSGVILNLQDYNSHLAKMQQGARGSWTYRLLFTAEPHEAVFLQTFYITLGHVAHWTGLSFDLTFQLARVICVGLMVWALWAFLAHYLGDSAALWALGLAIFGGGMGYLLFFFAPAMTANVSPIEFWLLDAYTFLSAFISPHFAAGVGLLALAFLMVDRWTDRPAPRQLTIMFLTSLAIAIVQPFDLILLDAILIAVAGYRLCRRRIAWTKALPGLVLIGISHAAILGYDWLVLYHFPIWTSFSAQNVTLSPPPVYYILGYAPTLLPALAGLYIAIRRRDGRWLVPILWLAGVAILIEWPGLLTQRRYVLGVQAPMAALAVYWFAEAGVPWLKKRLRKRYRLVLTVYGAVATLTTIALIVWLLAATRNPVNRELYIPDAVESAWGWIDEHTPTDAVFLASVGNGANLVGRTGRRAVVGHPIETADFAAKRAALSTFFGTDTDDDWRQAFLSGQHVAYLWYGADEQALGDWSPDEAGYLQKVFEAPGVTIYQVTLTFQVRRHTTAAGFAAARPSG